MDNAQLDRWFKSINEAIQDARTKAGNEGGLRSLVEAVQQLADVVREVGKNGRG
jgi:hypothetical protein